MMGAVLVGAAFVGWHGPIGVPRSGELPSRVGLHDAVSGAPQQAGGISLCGAAPTTSLAGVAAAAVAAMAAGLALPRRRAASKWKAGCRRPRALRAVPSIDKEKRQERLAAAELQDEEGPPPIVEFPGAVIIGGGRLGTAFRNMGIGFDAMMMRGEAFPDDAPAGPIYVCTRNDALSDVIASVPKERHEDLVFVQNGALKPFLDKELGKNVPVTILLVYFAVSKVGETPVDGKTDTDPDGLTAVNATGKWADEVAWRLTSSQLSCRKLREPSFTQAYWEKQTWISAYMLVGALHGGCTIGEVESEHFDEVNDLICELATAATAMYPDVRWDRGQLCERLAAYSRSVAHFPTAVKEFEWRNGVYHAMTLQAETLGRPDPCPLHTAGLREVGAIS